MSFAKGNKERPLLAKVNDKRTLQTSFADLKLPPTSRSNVRVILGMAHAATARGSSWPAALSTLIAQATRQVGETHPPGRSPLTCYFADRVSRTTPNAIHTEAGTLRKRAQRACGQCHSHKTKCSGDLPRCKRCEASNLVCEYMPTKRKFTNVRFNAAAGAEGQESAPAIPDESSVSSATTLMQGYQAMLADPASLSAECVPKLSHIDGPLLTLSLETQ